MGNLSYAAWRLMLEDLRPETKERIELEFTLDLIDITILFVLKKEAKRTVDLDQYVPISARTIRERMRILVKKGLVKSDKCLQSLNMTQTFNFLTKQGYLQTEAIKELIST